MRTSVQEETLELARVRVEGAQKIVDAQRQRVKWLRNRNFPDERALRVLLVYERSLEQLKKRLDFLETGHSTVSKRGAQLDITDKLSSAQVVSIRPAGTKVRGAARA